MFKIRFTQRILYDLIFETHLFQFIQDQANFTGIGCQVGGVDDVTTT